jgi:hypothetical protein
MISAEAIFVRERNRTLEKELEILDLYEEPEYSEESWQNTQSAIYESRLMPVLNLILAVVFLAPAFTAMSMGRAYWYLYLLFYVLGAAMLTLGIFHLASPILRREGTDLIGVSCGLIPKEHRIPHTALKTIQALPAVGTKKYSKFLRFYVELQPENGKKINLGERHMKEDDAVVLDEYLVPVDLRTKEAEKVTVIRPLLLLELAAAAVGVIGLIVNLVLPLH